MSYIIIIISSIFIIWSFIKYDHIYSFHTITFFAFFAFIGPQFIGLYNNPYPISLWAIDLSNFIASACLITCLISYSYFNNKKYCSKISNQYYSEKVFNIIFFFGVFYTIVGSFFIFLLGNLPIEELSSSQWTGTPVLYLFFARLIYPGFALLLFPTLKNPTFFKILLVFLSLALPLLRFFLLARRTELAILLSIIALGFFFTRNFKPKKFLVFIFCFLFILFSSSVGSYRNSLNSANANPYDILSISKKDWLGDVINSVSSVDWVDGINEANSGNKLSELKFAASVIEVSTEKGEYGFGTIYWNKFINNFVPSQLVGKDFRNSILISSPDFIGLTYNYYGQRTFRTGLTGVVVKDVYSQFSFFGPLVYIPVSWFFNRVWVIANNQNDLLIQIFYSLIIHTAAIAVVGGFGNMFNQIFYFYIFLLPVFYIRNKVIAQT